MNLQQTKKFSFSFFLLLLLTAGAFAQVRTVTGQVTDTEGKPVPGVTVVVKGTAGNVITDKEGRYRVQATPEQSIVFSHIAYTIKEVKVAEHPSVDVMLSKADSQMDDVIVIGYGSQRQRNITGSVASVNLTRLTDQPVPTVADALRGQVPGLSISGGGTRPGIAPTISVRQQFNWGKDGGVTNPLIVIDDVIQVDPSTGLSSTDRFNLLDLSEVESITVLRDATAAIYGSRASQGAIIIKTKKGKIGAPKITYSGKFETNNAVSFAKMQNAYEYGVFANRFVRASSNPTPAQLFSDAELERMKSIDYNWLDHAWSAANAMQHSVTVSGGAERATYFMGGSYYTQGANLGVNKFNRYSFRAGSDVTVANGLKFSASLGANNSDLHKSFTKIGISDTYGSQGGEQADFGILQHMPKYIPWSWNINGKDQYVSPSFGPNKVTAIVGNTLLSNTNYFALLNNGSNTSTQTFNYNANFSLAYDIPFIKGLTVKGSYAIQSSNAKTDQAQLPFVLVQNTGGASQDQHLFSDSTKWSSPTINNKQSRASFYSSTGTTQQMNFFVNYDRSFGDHNISIVASGERAKNAYYDNLLFYNTPGLGTYNGTSVTAGTIDPTLTISHKQENGTLSYLGRLNYAYKSRYLFQFIFRSDASSRFAPQNYWGKFPMASAGWVISDEDWFKDNVGFVNFLKIRGSMGITGNDNVKPWKWIQTYNILPGTGMAFGSSGGTLTNGITPDVVPNPNVKWDKNVQHNLGLDFSLLKNRLSVNIDKYWNNYTDLLTDMKGAVGVPWSVGGGFAEQNYSAANSWGEEITVTWKDRIANKVDYSISMNFAIGDNKTTKYFDQPFAYPSVIATRRAVGNSNTNIPFWGFRVWKNTSTGDGILRTNEDIDNYWQYLTDNANKSGVAGAAPSYDGITAKSSMKKGMIAYQDIRGALNADGTYGAPNGVIDNNNPQQDYDLLKKDTRTYGISTNLNFAYKGITLQAQIATSWGGYNTIDWVRNPTSSTTAAIWAQSILANNMYDSTDNPNGKYPNMVAADFGGTGSDASFWKVPSFRMYVRTLSIGYVVPKNLVKRARLDNARVYLSGNNLWDFYNPYPNHYRNMYDGPNVAYPTLRTWALGVNLGF